MMTGAAANTVELSGCPETGTGTLHLVAICSDVHKIREPVPVSGQRLTLLRFFPVFDLDFSDEENILKSTHAGLFEIAFEVGAQAVWGFAAGLMRVPCPPGAAARPPL
jgi:hypothetical protein